MSLEKRKLHRRKGLRQQQDSTYTSEHHHAMWWDIDYPIMLCDKTVNTVPNTQVGQILILNPVALMYVVKAEIMLTYQFIGAPSTFTITLSDCSGSTSMVSDVGAVYDLLRWDISDWVETILKEQCLVGLKTYFSVSAAINPIFIKGVSLRCTFYKNDTMGGYNSAVDPLLILKTGTNKDYLHEQAKLAEGFRYLSGLEME